MNTKASEKSTREAGLAYGNSESSDSNEQQYPYEEDLGNDSDYIYYWEADEFEKITRNRNWYIAVFVILTGLVAYSILTNNLLLSILIVMIGVTLYIFERKEPQRFNFTITYDGIIAQDQLYEFSNLTSFWIFYDQGKKVLSIKSKKNYLPYIHLPLGEADPVEIREVLLQFLPEVRHEEGIVGAVERYF